MRRLLTAGAVVAVAGVPTVLLTACAGSNKVSAADEGLQQQAARYEIFQIESTWHRGLAEHDVDLIMAVWAPNATFTIGPGDTLTGRKEIRHFFATQAEPLQPENHWIPETPTYKMRITVSGDRGTFYFECYFVDPKTKKLIEWVSNDQDVQKIGGRWLVTNAVSATPQLEP